MTSIEIDSDTTITEPQKELLDFLYNIYRGLWFHPYESGNYGFVYGNDRVLQKITTDALRSKGLLHTRGLWRTASFGIRLVEEGVGNARGISAKEYQRKATMTLVQSPNESDLQLVLRLLAGMVEESGEIAGHIKRIYRDDDGVLTQERANELIDEIGDAIWYLTVMTDTLGEVFDRPEMSLDIILERNLAKLRDRKERKVIHGSGDKR